MRSWHGLGSTRRTWREVLGSPFQKLPETQSSRDLAEMGSGSRAFRRGFYHSLRSLALTHSNRNFCGNITGESKQLHIYTGSLKHTSSAWSNSAVRSSPLQPKACISLRISVASLTPSFISVAQHRWPFNRVANLGCGCICNFNLEGPPRAGWLVYYALSCLRGDRPLMSRIHCSSAIAGFSRGPRFHSCSWEGHFCHQGHS